MRPIFLVATLIVACLAGTALAQKVHFLSSSRGLFTVRSRRQVRDCPNCVLLQDCPSMLRLLASRTRQGIYTVRSAICGFQGQFSQVCCPDPVSTRPIVSSPVRGDKQLLPLACGFSNDFNRIFGGTPTALGAYPWVAALGYIRPGSTQLQFHCSGSLINARYILTAAHCLDLGTLRGRRLAEIRLGDWNLVSDTDCSVTTTGEKCVPPYKVVKMESAVVHPQYSRRFQYSDDVGLIRLTEALDLQSLSPAIIPVCLPPTFAPGITAVGEMILAVGWGTTEAGRLSDTLQQVTLPIVEPERCREVYGTAFGDKQICAGGVQGRDTCSGDSGGPVVKVSPGGPYQQVGIVSFGLARCGTNNTPAVYTNVAEYRQWILDNMRM